MSGPNHPRGTSNTNTRGNAQARRVRRQWLLSEFGDGESAPCALRVSPRCQRTVTLASMEVDRFPVRGCDGGRYVRGNIRPACPPCNNHDGQTARVERLRARE